jgi:hypothetical protein
MHKAGLILEIRGVVDVVDVVLRDCQNKCVNGLSLEKRKNHDTQKEP